MGDVERPAGPARAGRRRSRRRGGGRRAYAALDLGTNNCRLLVAEPSAGGFRVVDGYSEIVRLGEGLGAAGRLSDAAMARTMGALRVCAGKISQWPVAGARCIATQACRGASNGAEFLARVKAETGLEFAVITPREEAELAVLGCASLMDPAAELALIVDIGGGSTELSWVERRAGAPEILEWTSLPFGVVTLAEKFGEMAEQSQGYAQMVAHVAEAIVAFKGADRLKPAFARGAAHHLGTSGTVTSLAGVWLRLPRYQRAKVDGLWLETQQALGVIAELRAADRAGRARNPCIGPERADLVVPGAAILEAIFQQWPTERIRVADRGLREGVLLTLMARDRGPHVRVEP